MRQGEWARWGTRGAWARGALGLALLLGLPLGAFGCRAGGQQGERPLEIAVPGSVSSLDPRFTTQSIDIKVTRLIHAGLVRLAPETLEPIPYLAESWHFVDPLTLELRLRPGLRFHSGKAFTTHDVCETLRAFADPALASPHRAVAEAIGQCEEKDPLQLVIRLQRPHATLLTDLEVPIFAAVQARAPAGTALDGLGPYRVAQRSEEAIELVPADTGVLPKPRHALTVRTIRDANVRVLRLIAGRSDIAPNSVPLVLLSALADEPKVHIAATQGANTTYLLLHNERAPFTDPQVRRAISNAIDRELIVRTLLARKARAASGLLPAPHWAAEPAAVALPFDIAQAREALAGHAEVTLLTSVDRARLTLARAVGQMLSDAGLHTKVVPLDGGALFERMDRGDYEMAILQMPELTEPNLLRWFFHASNVPGEGGQGKNRARYRSALVSQLLDEAAATPLREVRAPLYHRVAEHMLRDMPVVPLWHEDQVAVVSQRAAQFTLSAEGRWLAVAGL